jgi:drug/metabolite transporter (DMT)-like permease
MALAAVGSILALAVTFAPWYRIGPGHVSRSVGQESPLILVLLLTTALAAGVLTYAAARGRIPAKRTLVSVFVLTLVTTLAVAFRLFIERPGGNAATTLAFGGYPALLSINLVKASAVTSFVRARRRTT